MMQWPFMASCLMVLFINNPTLLIWGSVVLMNRETHAALALEICSKYTRYCVIQWYCAYCKATK